MADSDAKQLKALIRYLKVSEDNELAYFTRRRIAVAERKLRTVCEGFDVESHFEASYVLWLDRHSIQKLVRRARWIDLLHVILEGLERCAAHSGVTPFYAFALLRLWRIMRQMHNCRVVFETNSVL